MKTVRSIILVSAFGAVVALAPAAHASLLWISDANGNIGQVDTATGQVVAASVHNTGQSLTDIAFGTNGTMYGTTFTNLFTINTSTGAAAGVGAYAGESGMNALVGSGNAGVLLGASFLDSNIYTINQGTAAVAVLTHAPNTSSGDLAFAGSTLYGLGNSGGANTLNLLSGTPVTATTMHVGSTSGPTLSNVFGLADDGTTMYAVAGTEVYSVNLANAVLTALFDYSLHENGQNLTSVTGAAFIGEGGLPVPEPTSLALLGAGLLGFGVFARRPRR